MSDITMLQASYRAQPTPENLAALLRALQPIINAEVARYQGPRALLRLQAQRLAINAIRTYDPEHGAKLTSWVVSSMQPLTRYGRRMTQGVRVPEMVHRQAAEISRVRQQLLDDTGLEPTDADLADAVGLSPKRIKHIRESALPTISESALQERLDDHVPAETGGSDPRLGPATQLVLASMDDNDRKIFEWKTGHGGQVPMMNKDIAAKLGVTPAYISQRSNQLADRITEAMNNV